MKATCTVFVSILHTLHEAGITTVSQLAAQPQLHARFWLAAKDFCRFALLSKTGGKNRGGEILPGNAHKVDVLERFGATTREDLEADCLVRIMEKLDRLIAWQEAEQAKPKKRWETIVDKSVWAVLAAVIAFILARIGL